MRNQQKEDVMAIGEPCNLPAGFVVAPTPTVAPFSKLVSHTEESTVTRSLDHVLEADRRASLEDIIATDTPLPSVAGMHYLTEGGGDRPGGAGLFV